ncbi:TonB-dependent receptor [Mariniphaga sediminis]|uniref:TonB-dependent receptor n=1 Tax=Mariniphaga sediminis TaxID=1628158 RepID=UPI003561D1D9
MKRIIIFFLSIFPLWLNGQSKFTISGYITDSANGERLAGATVYNKSTGKGAAANAYGFFSLTEKEGLCNLSFRFVGFREYTVNLELKNDTFINIPLQKGIEIEEIEINAQRQVRGNPELSILNRQQVDMQMVESAPVILGEHDVLKTLQFMPGIKQGAENTAGYNVRGGSADQNLILLDGVPVYNVNHLMVFFSVFNTDAIKSAELIKGGIPARYGGRLSSVLDVTMKEGNLKESRGIFSISPVAGRITYESPIKMDTSAFIISLRRTFLDLPMVAFQKLNGDNYNFGYYFYDLNAKANWKFNPENRLYLSFYTGTDKLFHNTKESKKDKSSYNYSWGNFTTVLRWNKMFSPKLFSNLALYYSRFNHRQTGKTKSDDLHTLFKTMTLLDDISFKADFDYYFQPQYTLRFGAKASHLIFNPNIIQLKSKNSDVSFNEENRSNAKQVEMYLENAFSFGWLALNLGSRVSGYFTGEKSYIHFQPRLAANLYFSPSFSASASFTQMTQNMHLLTNSSLGMPTDLWVASTDKIGPQLSKQITVGLTYEPAPNYIFGIEGYYKIMNHVIRFDEGVAFLNPKESGWEENVLVGDGKAFGVEFLAEKQKGRLTGIFSYTLSRSERKFNELNQGNWFPFKYDRLHDISVLAEYRLNKRYNTSRSISVGFTLQSGNNLSMPDTEIEGMLLPGTDFAEHPIPWQKKRFTYSNPNNLKIPAFHHLDIGYNITKQKTDSKSITWSFSVYNVYNRMNPWYYYKNQSGQVKQVSVFPIIPSVAFKYVF